MAKRILATGKVFQALVDAVICKGAGLSLSNLMLEHVVNLATGPNLEAVAEALLVTSFIMKVFHLNPCDGD